MREGSLNRTRWDKAKIAYLPRGGVGKALRNSILAMAFHHDETKRYPSG
jgi:hypothetical protein